MYNVMFGPGNMTVYGTIFGVCPFLAAIIY